MPSSLAEENWDYYIGNHRQFWNGPMPQKDHPMYPEIVKEIDRLFHRYNICAEVVDQFVNALIGKPFSWSLKLKSAKKGNEETQEEISQKLEAEAILSNWFEWQTEVAVDQDLGDPIANAITQMMVRDQGSGAGVGYLRLYLPQIYQNLDPYQQIVVHSPPPGTVEATRNKEGILYQVEYTYGDGEQEVYELQVDGTTKITNKKTGESVVRDYGGRLPIIELKARAIVNEAVKDGQKAINRALTIKEINNESAGFLERIISNALPPGEYQLDAQGNKTYVVDLKKFELGPNKIAWINGLPIGDINEPSGYTNPDITYRNPVSIENFRDSIQLDTATIYFQVGLAYLLSSGDGKISGKSRLTLKEDFLIRLRGYERIIESSIRKMLAIVIVQLKPFYPVLDLYRPVVELNLAVSPLPEERQQNREDVKAGIMSIPTAIASNGVDVQKEINLIKQYIPLLKMLTEANTQQSETNASDRVEDRLREKEKGNS